MVHNISNSSNTYVVKSILKVGEWIKQVDCDMDGKLSYKEQQYWNII